MRERLFRAAQTMVVGVGLLMSVIALTLCVSIPKAHADSFVAGEPSEGFNNAKLITVGQTVRVGHEEANPYRYYKVVLPESGMVDVTFANDRYYRALFGCQFDLAVCNRYYEEVGWAWVFGTDTRPVTETFKLSKGVNYIRVNHNRWTSSPMDGHPYHFKLTYKVTGTNVTKVLPAKKGFTVKWAKKAKTMKYQVRYSNKKNMKGAKVVSISCKNSSKKISGLKAKKKYYVQVRLVRSIGGKVYYSQWSAKKTVTTKK